MFFLKIKTWHLFCLFFLLPETDGGPFRRKGSSKQIKVPQQISILQKSSVSVVLTEKLWKKEFHLNKLTSFSANIWTTFDFLKELVCSLELDLVQKLQFDDLSFTLKKEMFLFQNNDAILKVIYKYVNAEIKHIHHLEGKNVNILSNTFLYVRWTNQTQINIILKCGFTDPLNW